MLIHYLVTSLERGGAEFSIPSIVQVLRNLGHEVHVYVCEPRDRVAESRLVEAGIAYTVLFEGRARKEGSVIRYAKVASASRPDLIWTSLSHATLVGQVVGAILGIPVVSWKHSADAKRYIRWTHRLSRLWIADSADVSAFLTDSMGVPHSRIATWPLFSAAAIDGVQARWNGTDTLKIGSSGRLHPQKNYDLLLRAMARLRESDEWAFSRIQLSIAGEGPERCRLEQLIRSLDLGSNVTLLGWVDDVANYLKGLHVYVQPSAYEGMCIAAHEAMAAGLPVLASPVGELKRSIRPDVTGIHLDGDIVESTVRALRRLFNHPEEMTRLGEGARRYVLETMGPGTFARSGREVMSRVEMSLQQLHRRALMRGGQRQA